jgi:hypothetical protein
MALISLLAILSFCLLAVLADDPVSLERISRYHEQRECAYHCFANLSVPGDLIAHALGCAEEPPMNDCFCRPDLQQSAASYLSGCVGGYCDGNTVDINQATAVYKEYCTSAGYTMPMTGVEATTTPSGGFTVTATITIAEATVTVTAPSSNSACASYAHPYLPALIAVCCSMLVVGSSYLPLRMI